MSSWHIVEPAHVRDKFDCGEESLNAFLRTYAGQNARRDISRTHVALPENSNEIAGYYTLSSGSVTIEDFPAELAKRLPKYPVPTVHLGRLAVDRCFRGRGLGGLLLIDALQRVRSLADQVGIYAVTVYALNANARQFYEHHGFLTLEDETDHLYLPMTAIRNL